MLHGRLAAGDSTGSHAAMDRRFAMLEGLLSSIRQIGIFMICAQALIHFKPKGSYEKYLKLLVSAMILVQLLSPVAALLTGRESREFQDRIAFYSESFEQGLGEAALEEYRVEQLRQRLLAAQLEQLDLFSEEAEEPENGQEGTQRETEEILIQIDPVEITVP